MLEYALGSLVTAGIGMGAIVYFYKHPEKFEKWLSMLLTLLGYITKKYKRYQIKYDIQSSLNDYVSRLSNDTNIADIGVKIKWAGRDEDEDVNWEEDNVVLILQDRGQKNRNFVHAAYLFTSTSLLRNTKTHLSKKQAIAIDLFTTGKMIEEENPPALDYFIQGIANPLLDDEKVKDLVEQFEDIDKSGYYTHVLLQELEYLSTKIVFSARKQEVYEEVAKLIQFLRLFAMREVGDDTIPEEFVGKFLRCSIKIVSTEHVRNSGKTQGPAERIARAFEKGIENVYIIGPVDDGGKDFIESVCNHPKLDESHLVRVRTKAFKGVTTRNGQSTPANTYMVQFQNNSKRKFINDKDIHQKIEEYSQEISQEQTAAQPEI